MDDISLKSRRNNNISIDHDDMTRVDEGNGPRQSKRMKEILNTSVFQDDNHEDNNDDDNKDDSSVEYDTDDGDEPPPPKKHTSQLPMRFLPSETPRLEALSHFMQFDLSSNNVGQCDGAGCGLWHLEFLDSGNRRRHNTGPRSERFTCGYVFAVEFTVEEMARAKSIVSRSLCAHSREDKFKFDKLER